eukprot:636124-Hanusia_phi.AAC.1
MHVVLDESRGKKGDRGAGQGRFPCHRARGKLGKRARGGKGGEGVTVMAEFLLTSVSFPRRAEVTILRSASEQEDFVAKCEVGCRGRRRGPKAKFQDCFDVGGYYEECDTEKSTLFAFSPPSSFSSSSSSSSVSPSPSPSPSPSIVA